MEKITKKNGAYFANDHEIQVYECSLFDAVTADVIQPIKHLIDIDMQENPIPDAWFLLDRIHMFNKEKLERLCQCLEKHFGEIRLIRALPGQIAIRDFQIVDLKFKPTSIKLNIILGKYDHGGPDDLDLGNGIEIRDGGFFLKDKGLEIDSNDFEFALEDATIWGIENLLNVMNPEQKSNHHVFALLQVVHESSKEKIEKISHFIMERLGRIEIITSHCDQWGIKEGQCIYVDYYPDPNVLSLMEGTQTVSDKAHGQNVLSEAGQGHHKSKPEAASGAPGPTL